MGFSKGLNNGAGSELRLPLTLPPYILVVTGPDGYSANPHRQNMAITVLLNEKRERCTSSAQAVENIKKLDKQRQNIQLLRLGKNLSMAWIWSIMHCYQKVDTGT
jgi:hypothetical protein